MDAIYYSLAFQGSQAAAVQLARSLESLRRHDPAIPVFIFLFGEAPAGLVEGLRKLGAQVRHLGDYRDYIARTEPGRAELFALDPRLHRWLILEEPELKACARLLYIDSDTYFFAPAIALFDRYRGADLYAREEPSCRRSILGYDRSVLDEEELDSIRALEGLGFVAPFNTGVCLFNRRMADSITRILPLYFDYLFRFMAWFHHHPLPGGAPAAGSAHGPVERFLGPVAAQALPYRWDNRWIVDQVGLWLALGRLPDLRFGDFEPGHVCQGPEYERAPESEPLPILCHYFGCNMAEFFEWIERSPRRGLRW